VADNIPVTSFLIGIVQKIGQELTFTTVFLLNSSMQKHIDFGD